MEIMGTSESKVLLGDNAIVSLSIMLSFGTHLFMSLTVNCALLQGEKERGKYF